MMSASENDAIRDTQVPRFPCDSCGICCRKLFLNAMYEDLDRGDGVCRFLDTDTNLCTTYDTRPDKCNVDAMYHLYYSDRCSLEEFHRMNYAVCRQWQIEAEAQK